MAQVRDLIELTLVDLWRDIKWQSGYWWQEMEPRQLRVVKTLLQSSLEGDLLGKLQASRYNRVKSRKGYRNGHYERSLRTKHGMIKALRVPLARESHSSEVLPRYQRRQVKVDKMIREMSAEGAGSVRLWYRAGR